MMILSSFNGLNYIYKLTFCRKNLESLLDSGYNIMLIEENVVSLFPDNRSFQLTDNEKNYLYALGEGACLEFSSNGRIS